MVLKSQKISDSNGQIIEGPLLIKPNVFNDERGFFMESWNSKDWKSIIEESKQEFNLFLQDNHSKSSIGVLRGLHYQLNPYAQGKLVRCISGEIFDVAVDIRINSPTFGKYVGEFLSSENYLQLWIPEGFAHGFLTISEKAEVVYKTTNIWDKNSERSIKWDDPSINIEWPEIILKNNEILISTKDSQAPLLSEVNSKDLF
jgi:dTDP-4-dehydrorhamnose 3,5-epimerase